MSNFVKRDTVTTRNGKNVIVDTRYVPYPLGRGFETQVFTSYKNGQANYRKGVLDEKRYGESESAAETGHGKMVSKWAKQTLV